MSPDCNEFVKVANIAAVGHCCRRIFTFNVYEYVLTGTYIHTNTVVSQNNGIFYA